MNWLDLIWILGEGIDLNLPYLDLRRDIDSSSSSRFGVGGLDFGIILSFWKDWSIDHQCFIFVCFIF